MDCPVPLASNVSSFSWTVLEGQRMVYRGFSFSFWMILRFSWVEKWYFLPAFLYSELYWSQGGDWQWIAFLWHKPDSLLTHKLQGIVGAVSQGQARGPQSQAREEPQKPDWKPLRLGWKPGLKHTKPGWMLPRPGWRPPKEALRTWQRPQGLAFEAWPPWPGVNALKPGSSSQRPSSRPFEAWLETCARPHWGDGKKNICMYRCTCAQIPLLYTASPPLGPLLKKHEAMTIMAEKVR